MTVGSDTVTIDFALQLAGAVSGRITDAATGAPLNLWSVGASGSSAGSAATSSSGVYTITGLVPGRYRVFTGGAPYYDQTFASVVTVTGGATTGGIDFQMHKLDGGSISGKLGAPTPPPNGVSGVSNSRVVAYASDGTLVREARLIYTGDLWWDGAYVIEGLAPGAYFVRYENPVGDRKSVV